LQIYTVLQYNRCVFYVAFASERAKYFVGYMYIWPSLLYIVVFFDELST